MKEAITRFIMKLAELFENNEFCLNVLTIVLAIFVSYSLYCYITDKPIAIKDNGDGTETYYGLRGKYIVGKEKE